MFVSYLPFIQVLKSPIHIKMELAISNTKKNHENVVLKDYLKRF